MEIDTERNLYVFTASEWNSLMPEYKTRPHEKYYWDIEGSWRFLGLASTAERNWQRLDCQRIADPGERLQKIRKRVVALFDIPRIIDTVIEHVAIGDEIEAELN
jgi:hypothetical protein